MRLIQFVAALTATSSGAFITSAANLPLPPLPPWYPLEPWQVSSLYEYNPYTSPYDVNSSGLVLTIANPKLIAATPAPHASGGGYVVFPNSTARCELHWKTDEFTPYGHSSNSCVTAATSPGQFSQALWSITLNELHEDLAGPGDHYFSVSFELALNGSIYGGQPYKRMTGSVIFQSGQNLQGQCGEDGLCEFELTDGTSPVLLQPTLQECRSACG
ncbi:hypothetical protein HD806DRAFT_67814 [Xylariaceae sp. AK1471]|nr:hypothetical protein HD806DRAFT_67814 [Xylariaceae sp. AK1471]